MASQDPQDSWWDGTEAFLNGQAIDTDHEQTTLLEDEHVCALIIVRARKRKGSQQRRDVCIELTPKKSPEGVHFEGARLELHNGKASYSKGLSRSGRTSMTVRPARHSIFVRRPS